MNKSLQEAFKSAVNDQQNKSVFQIPTRSFDINVLAAAYVNTASTFADFDMDIVKANDALVHKDTFSERTVSIESAMFVAENLSFLLSMLILNYKDFRDYVADIISCEVSIDCASDKDRKKSRINMKIQDPLPITYTMSIGITVFSPEVLANLYDAGLNSFTTNASESLISAINNAMKTYSKKDRKDVGILLSSYIYILRALNYNPSFFARVADLVQSFKQDYGIKV